MIVGKDDAPLFTVDVSTDGERDDSPHLDEFIIHSSLDSVDAVLVRYYLPRIMLCACSRMPQKGSYEQSTALTIFLFQFTRVLDKCG